MRVAIVGNFGLAGKQTMAMRALPLAEVLAARGHALLVALPVRGGEAPPVGPAVQGICLHLVGRAPNIPVLTQLFQVVRLTWLCLRWKPDLLYCFKPIAYSWAVLSLFRTLRWLRLFGGTIALDSDDWEGEGGWNEKQPFPGWLKRWIAWQEKWSLRHADVVTVASRALARLAKEAATARIVYVPNALRGEALGAGVPDVSGIKAALGSSDVPAVLVYTRFVEFSVDRLLHTFRRILSQIPEARLLVVGAGLNGEEGELRRKGDASGVGAQIAITGWLQPEELSNYLAAADVALYLMDDTLLNRTKCPVKLLELMGAGVPVVADRVGQAAEYLEDGGTGFLVHPEDPEAMADRAVSLLRDPQGRSSMGEGARRDVAGRWTWSVWADVVEMALVEAVSERR